MKKAYDNWDQVVEYDGKSLVNAEQNNNSVESENELHDSIDFGTGLDHQLQMPALPMSVPSEQQMNSGMGKPFCFLELHFDGSSPFVPPLPFSFERRCHIFSYLCLKLKMNLLIMQLF